MSRKNSPKRNKNRQKNSLIIKNKLHIQNIIKAYKSLDNKTVRMYTEILKEFMPIDLEIERQKENF